MRILRKIEKLKEKRNAIVVAHHFQRPEVQDMADFVGGKLECAKFARESEAEVVVVAGVDFMAELVKLFAPEKTVLHPKEDAMCPMVFMVEEEQLKGLNEFVAGYIKARAWQMAYCSAVADVDGLLKLLEDKEKGYIVPDGYVADYINSKLNKSFTPAEGYCPPHTRILPEDVKKLKEEHPNAVVVAHPQCRGDVLALADYISSTTGMKEYVKNSRAGEFIVCSEREFVYSLSRAFPDKKFYHPTELAFCRNHKSIDLGDIYLALKEMEIKVEIPEDIREKAAEALKAGGVL